MNETETIISTWHEIGWYYTSVWNNQRLIQIK